MYVGPTNISALARIPAVHGDVRVLADVGAGHIGAIRSFLTRAADDGERVFGDVFRLDHPDVIAAIDDAAGRGGVSLLMDHGDALPALQHLVGRDGVELAGYGAAAIDGSGASAFVDHAKGWATRRHLLFSTASPHGNGVGQVNLTLELGADPARAYAGAITAGIGGTYDARRAALEAARDAGVVINDPELGVRHLDDAMRAVINGSEHDLRVVIKEFLDPSWARDIVRARARGVDARVVTRQIDDVSHAILRDARIPVGPLPMTGPPGIWRHELADKLTWRRLHFNSVSADDDTRMVVGTRYFWEPSKPGDRIARESGIVLAGPGTAAVRASIDRLTGPLATARDAVALLRGRG
jgi:hypothetical protein